MKIYPVCTKFCNRTAFCAENDNKPKPSKISFNKKDAVLALSVAGVVGLALVNINQRSRIKNLSNKFEQNIKEELYNYTVKSFENTDLYPKFIDAKTGFMDFISSLNSEPKKVKEFLFGVTADKKVAGEFISEITADPRQSARNLKILEEKIGGEKNLLDWLEAPNGYNEAYDKYVHSLFKNNDIEVENLLKISPNWHLYILTNLKNKEKLTIGELPKDFAHIDNFSHFAKWLNFQEFIDNKPSCLEYSGQYFEATRLNQGTSGKIPYKIKFLGEQSSGQEYVLKVQQSRGCNSPFAKESLLYRGDSTFINAQIDYYLGLHNCENIPKMYYFDLDSCSALYEFQTGNKFKTTTNVRDANTMLKDLNSLGIYYNDVGAANILEKDGVLKIIDIGESTFIDPLRPGSKGYNFEMPNWCGIKQPNLTFLHMEHLYK